MKRYRAAGLRPILLIPWLVLTLADGGIHDHGPPSGDRSGRLLRSGTPATAFLSTAGDSRPSSDSYCSACIWQLTAHFVLVTAPALPPPAAPPMPLPTYEAEAPAVARPRPTARAPPSA